MTTKSVVTGNITITINAEFKGEVTESGTEFTEIQADATNKLSCAFTPQVAMTEDQAKLFNAIAVDAVVKYVAKYQADKMKALGMTPGVVVVDNVIDTGSKKGGHNVH